MSAGLRRRGLALAAVVLLMSGCPLSTDVPLSDPADAVIDTGLLGTWRAKDPETGEENLLRILAFNEREMVALMPDAQPAGMVSAMRLFPTRIGGQTFLNIRELGSTDGGWFFARCVVTPDRLRMTVVEDALFKNQTFAGSAELRAAFEKNLSDPRMFGDAGNTPSDIVLERVVDERPPKSAP